MAFSSNELFRFTGIPQGDFPNVILTDESKDLFERARFAGSLDIQGNSVQRGQGLVGIAWLGKNQEKENVLYIDLIPAFNKNDNRPQSDRYDVKYEEHQHAFTNEPLGGNSGRNHEKLLSILTSRIQKAYDLKKTEGLETKELAKYDGLYTISNEKIVIDKTKLFGFGIFKGDENILLYSFRNKSANLNPFSIEYNPEFLLINYFSSDIDTIFPNEYHIKRSLPAVVSEKIQSSLLDQLPLESKSTRRLCQEDETFFSKNIDTTWEKIKNDPITKNAFLLESLSQFCDMKTSKIEKIKEILFYMEKNIQSISPDLKEPNQLLSDLLLSPSQYKSQSILISAIDHNHTEIIDFILSKLNNTDLTEILCYAIQKNNINAVRLLLQKNINKNSKGLTESLFFAAKEGYREVINCFEEDRILLDGLNIEGNTFSQCLSEGLIKIAKKEDYYELMKTLQDYSDEKLEIESVKDDLRDIFYKNIEKGGMENILRLKEIFPEWFDEFVYSGEEKLISVYEDFNEENDLSCPAPIYSAIIGGQLDMLKFFIEDYFPDLKNNNIIREKCFTSYVFGVIYDHISKEQYDDIRKVLHENSHVISIDEILSENGVVRSLFDKFHKHICNGNISKLKEFKDIFPKLYSNFLNDIHPNGFTAIMSAVSHNQIDMTKYLLNEIAVKKQDDLEEKKQDIEEEYEIEEEKETQNEVQLEIRNSDYLTPLLQAALKGHLEIVDLLLKHGANKDAKEDNKDFIDYLQLYAISCAHQHNYDELVKLQNKYPDVDLISPNNDGESVLDIILQKSADIDLQSLKIIQKIPAIFNELIQNINYVELAIFNGDFEKIKLLLENKIDLTLVDQGGNSLFLLAAQNGQSKILDLLLKNAPHETMQASIHETLFRSSIIDLPKLIYFETYFPDLFNVNDALFYLFSEFSTQRNKIFNYLLSKKPDLEMKNANGETPLLLAAKNGHFDIVDMLLEQKVNQNVVSFDELTFGDCLAKGILSKTPIKLDKLKNIMHKFPDVNIDFNNVYLGVSINSALFNVLIDYIKTQNIEELKALKADFPDFFKKAIDMQTKLGTTPLIECFDTTTPNIPLVRFLLESKPNLSIEDQLGHTAIIRAIHNNCYEGAKILIDAGSSSNFTDFLFSKTKENIKNNYYDLLEQFKKYLPDFFNQMLEIAVKKNDFHIISSLLQMEANITNDDKHIIACVDRCKKIITLEEKDICSNRYKAFSALYQRTSSTEFDSAFIQFSQLDTFIKKLSTISNAKLNELAQSAYTAYSEKPNEVSLIIDNLIKNVEKISKEIVPPFDRGLFEGSNELHMKNQLDSILRDVISNRRSLGYF